MKYGKTFKILKKGKENKNLRVELGHEKGEILPAGVCYTLPSRYRVRLRSDDGGPGRGIRGVTLNNLEKEDALFFPSSKITVCDDFLTAGAEKWKGTSIRSALFTDILGGRPREVTLKKEGKLVRITSEVPLFIDPLNPLTMADGRSLSFLFTADLADMRCWKEPRWFRSKLPDASYRYGLILEIQGVAPVWERLESPGECLTAGGCCISSAFYGQWSAKILKYLSIEGGRRVNDISEKMKLPQGMVRAFLALLVQENKAVQTDGWYTVTDLKALSPLARHILKTMDEESLLGTTIMDFRSPGERDVVEKLSRSGLIVPVQDWFIQPRSLEECRAWYNGIRETIPREELLAAVQKKWNLSRNKAFPLMLLLRGDDEE